MAQRAPSLVSDTHYCVMGDVTIEATAAIASGVVLQAASGSRIVVGKGVCLAAGVCIQSRAGVLNIAAGASLGANVLVVGHGSVGANACISAGSTVINPAVEAGAVLPPDTLIEPSQTAVSPPGMNAPPVASDFANNFVNNEVKQPFGYSYSTNSVQSGYDASQNGASQNSQNVSSIEVRSAYDRVYGREQVSQLISTLFPHRKPLDGNASP